MYHVFLLPLQANCKKNVLLLPVSYAQYTHYSRTIHALFTHNKRTIRILSVEDIGEKKKTKQLINNIY